MTLISVGSTGAPGASTGTRGSTSGGDAAPDGFDVLLAGAHSAHEKEPAGESTRDATPDDPCDASTPNAAATAPADGVDDADATDHADDSGDDSGDSTGDSTTKPAAGTDQAALLAALAALTLTTPTPVTPTPETGAGASVRAVPAATVVVPDADMLLALATESAATVLIGGTDGADAITNPITPPVEPKLLPVPNLPTAGAAAPHANANDANPNTLAPAIETQPSLPTAAAPAPVPDHPRPAPPAPSPVSGPATFAAALPANAPAATNVNVDAGATATAAIAPPPPAEQLVSVLTPMRTTPNGTYTLRLELKPPELGRIEMRVEMRDGVLHASIHAEHEGSGQMLRDALGELRDRLGAEGVRTGALTVSDGSVGSRQHPGARAADRPNSAAPGSANDDPNPASPPPLLPTPDSDTDSTSLLDVRV